VRRSTATVCGTGGSTSSIASRPTAGRSSVSPACSSRALSIRRDGQARYPGVALFTVLPGPVSALDALEDLLVTSRALAVQLGGTVLDEKGAPLSLQRIAHMRDDVLAFERNARAHAAAG
jgi:hypothetical protein